MVERDRLGALVWQARATRFVIIYQDEHILHALCAIFNILKIKLKLITS